MKTQRPLPVTIAAILLVLLSLFDFPWPYQLLFPMAEAPPAFILYSGYVLGLVGHHRCLCTQLPCRSAGSGHGARRSTESRYRSNGGSGCPHHRAGSAPDFAAYLRKCLSFRDRGQLSTITRARCEL